MITKRITAQTRLVSQFDDAYILGFEQETKDKYLETLDIKELGSLKELKEQPTVFVCQPLKTKYEYLIYSDNIDPWLIFSTHVDSLENCEDIKLSHKHGIIDDEVKELLPPRIVQDIAHMVISKANQSGSEVFFTQSAASYRYSQAVIIKDASRDRQALAQMVNAKTKDSE